MGVGKEQLWRRAQWGEKGATGWWRERCNRGGFDENNEAGVGGETDPTASLSNFVDMADGAVRESGLEPR